ncbi:MAG: hypothetical protein WCR21_04735 [Bacteroidota bacterium]
MTLEKVHHKLQLQALEILKSLNNFTDENIQASVEECEILQKQLVTIQENLAVYKFQKLSKEISPSFQIHSKVSAVESKQEITMASPNAIPPIEIQSIEMPSAKTTQTEKPNLNNDLPLQSHESAKTNNAAETKASENIVSEIKPATKPLAIAINDKFRFINELFLHNAAEYNIAIEQINNLNSWTDCDLYLSSLKQLYHWQDQNEVAKQLFALVKKRFE